MATRARRIFDANRKVQVIRMIKGQDHSAQNVSENAGGDFMRYSVALTS